MPQELYQPEIGETIRWLIPFDDIGDWIQFYIDLGCDDIWIDEILKRLIPEYAVLSLRERRDIVATGFEKHGKGLTKKST